MASQLGIDAPLYGQHGLHQLYALQALQALQALHASGSTVCIRQHGYASGSSCSPQLHDKDLLVL